MTVIVQFDEEVKTFKDVTRIETSLAFNMFENEVVLYQGRKQTRIKQYETNGFGVFE